MQLTIRLLRETDGRSIADIPELPGVTVYGSTADEATVALSEMVKHTGLRPEDL